METLFCNLCTRQFQRKHAYDSHVLTCPKLYDGEKMPSQEQLYFMVLELHKKCEKMQNEIRSLKNLELKEKKKIDVFEWLPQNISPNETWESIIGNIEEKMNNSIELLRNNNLQKCLLQIIDSISLPCIVFSHKKTTLYIYHDSNRWCEYNFSKIRDLYNAIHKQLISSVNKWVESKGENLYSNDHLSRVYNDMIGKVLCGTDDDGIEKVFKKIDSEMRKKLCISL